MEITVKSTRIISFSETKERELEINGEMHTLRTFDSNYEDPIYWFDGIEYNFSELEEEVMEGITLEEILNSI
jgi:hypothetical protein